MFRRYIYLAKLLSDLNQILFDTQMKTVVSVLYEALYIYLLYYRENMDDVLVYQVCQLYGDKYRLDKRTVKGTGQLFQEKLFFFSWAKLNI